LKRKAVSRIVLTLVLIGMLTFILDLTPVSAVESPYIMVIPETTVNPTLNLGMNYTVSIYTDCIQTDITAYQFNISYNPSVLKGIEVVNGDLIVGGSAQFINGTFNNIEGSLSLTAGFYFESEVTSGPGILANVTFTVVDYGASVITLGSKTRLFGWDYWFWTEYTIIDAATMPTHIQHGYFCNLAEPVVHDIIVSAVTPRPTVVERGETVNVHVVVGNQGTQTETFDVKAYYNYDPGFPNANIIGTKTISNLASGASISLDFGWNTLDVTEENYTITAIAGPVDSETDTEDNTLQSDEMVKVNIPAFIYIMADGRVNPPSAPVSSVDNITYTLTGDIYKSIVVEKDNIVVDGLGYTAQEAGILLKGRSNITIKNMDMHPGSIYLRHSSNITISGNNITNPYGYGIASEDSPYLTIIGNNITNILSGISLLRSEKSSISGNNVTADIYGIDITDSSHTSVSGNTITGNEFGISIIGFEGVGYSVCGNNIVRGGLGLKLYWVSNSTIHGNNITTEVGMSIENAQNNRIAENNIISSDLGIVLWFSDYNIITGNTITGQRDNPFIGPTGIYLVESSNNSFTENTITGNDYGIIPSWSLNNAFFHNNLLNNTVQADVVAGYVNTWNNGYPSGGNYWSDYAGVDLYNGPHQNETGSDGIGDTPYIIDENNQDNYPLMHPWAPAPPTVVANADVVPDTLNLKSKGEWITCYIELPEDHNVSAIDISTVMLNDTIPVSLLDVPAPEPVPTEIGDYDSDGIPDLMVKFNRTMVSELVLSEDTTYSSVTLTVKGEISGTPFEGTDIVKVLFPGDVDDDGDVDWFDFSLLAEAYGSNVDDVKYNWFADFNEDQNIDWFDFSILAEYYGKTAI
jgi:parallel beta-helix repeat protein